MGRTRRIRLRKRRTYENKSVNSDKQKFNKKIIAFLRWLKLKYNYRSNLKIVNLPGEGNCLFTGRHGFKPNDCILQIPPDLFIRASKLRATLPTIFTPAMHELDCLVVFLIHQKYVLGSTSEWNEYIDLLPTSLPINFKKLHELRHLLPDGFRKQIDDSFQSMTECFDRIDGSNYQFSDINFVNKFDWAFEMVTSRSVYLNQMDQSKDSSPDTMALIPFMDLINHNYECDVVVTSSVKDGFRVTTRQPIPPYSQVYVRYGNYNNRQLLLNYGFHFIRYPTISNSVFLKLYPCSRDALSITFKQVIERLKFVMQAQPHYFQIETRVLALLDIGFVHVDDVFELKWPVRFTAKTNGYLVNLNDSKSWIDFDDEPLNFTELLSEVNWKLDLLFQLFSRLTWASNSDINRLIYSENIGNNPQVLLNAQERILYLKCWFSTVRFQTRTNYPAIYDDCHNYIGGQILFDHWNYLQSQLGELDQLKSLLFNEACLLSFIVQYGTFCLAPNYNSRFVNFNINRNNKQRNSSRKNLRNA